MTLRTSASKCRLSADLLCCPLICETWLPLRELFSEIMLSVKDHDEALLNLILSAMSVCDVVVVKPEALRYFGGLLLLFYVFIC